MSDKIDFSKFLATTTYGKLSASQIVMACDAGFTDEEIEGANQPWYQANRKHMLHKSGTDAPALAKQISYLLTITNIDPNGKHLFGECKAVIRAYGEANGRDRYIQAIKELNTLEAEVRQDSRERVADRQKPIKKVDSLDDTDEVLKSLPTSNEDAELKAYFKSLKKK